MCAQCADRCAKVLILESICKYDSASLQPLRGCALLVVGFTKAIRL